MMRKRLLSMLRTVGFLAVAAVIAGATVSCTPRPVGEVGTEIISAKEAISMVETEDIVLVDARTVLEYRQGHIDSAVQIARADIIVMEPFPGLLAPPEQIEAVLSSRGVSNDSMIVIYDDNNNMDSARLWWTLKIYGHDAVKVVSGGFKSLQSAGAKITTDSPEIVKTDYVISEFRESMLVTAAEIRNNINTPDSNIIVIDTRTDAEVMKGNIPGSIHINYLENNFRDGSYRPPSHIKIKYLEAGIDFEKEIHLYCQTSIRASASFLALYNAGYRNLRLFDGAWAEWSSNPLNPVYVPELPAANLGAGDQS